MWPSGWGEARARGLRSVWARNGVELPAAHGRALPALEEECVAQAVHELLGDPGAGGERSTALFCDADWVASHAIRATRSMRLRVPEDVSIVGFDDASFATVLDPPLTTVRQPIRELSALAVALLVEQLSLGEPISRSYGLPCELVIRGTTAPAKSATE